MQVILNKLLIKTPTTYQMIQAPSFWIESIQASPLLLPANPSHIVHWFITSKADFEAGIAKALSCLAADGRLWISYRKQTKTETFDLARDSLNLLAQARGLRAFRQVAINDEWSALGFVLNN
jgi:hypothetical protein